MQRHRTLARPEWRSEVERVGLTYHTADTQTYWDESVYWEFTAAEIDRIEAATAELQEMCLAAGDFILNHDRLTSMEIPEAAQERIRETWKTEPPALYGRMDLAYNGCELKLLEYNADTPTALVEGAVAQWYWLNAVFPEQTSSTPFMSIWLPSGRHWPARCGSQCISGASRATKTG